MCQYIIYLVHRQSHLNLQDLQFMLQLQIIYFKYLKLITTLWISTSYPLDCFEIFKAYYSYSIVSYFFIN